MHLVLQAAALDVLSFDPFSLHQNALAASKVDVSRGEIVEALMVALVIVVRHEGFNLSLQITGKEVVLQKDAILECLVPALDLALGHGVVRRSPHVKWTCKGACGER
jgi:hypothetical protein